MSIVIFIFIIIIAKLGPSLIGYCMSRASSSSLAYFHHRHLQHRRHDLRRSGPLHHHRPAFNYTLVCPWGDATPHIGATTARWM
jgi:hypothetical protein